MYVWRTWLCIGTRTPTPTCATDATAARLAQPTKVVRDGDHFVARNSGVDEHHASPALHDNDVALNALAFMGQYALCDLP